ncbi:MAG: Hsp20/alpha crystallin family protein [Kiritimatiellae bacterium]|nr:Hsp20/alpha crystallin family protein [Kiritimatiellia bacterium]
MNNLIPWKRRKDQSVAPRRAEDTHPFAQLHHQMNDLIERFFQDWEAPFDVPAPAPGAGMMGFNSPAVDVTETDDELQVTADLPGLSEKDVEVSLDEQSLVLRGEKRVDREEKKRNWHISERSYGSFQRAIPLPSGLDTARIKASFKNGVLTVRLPKTQEAKARRRTIEIASD